MHIYWQFNGIIYPLDRLKYIITEHNLESSPRLNSLLVSSPDHTLYASFERGSGVLGRLSWARKSGMSDRPSDWSTSQILRNINRSPAFQDGGNATLSRIFNLHG